MYTILSVSRNTRLLLQRNDTLALAGFRVVSPRIPEDAPSLAQQQKVDAVIIGHSVEAESRASLIPFLREACPACLVFFVYTGETQVEPLADASIDVSDSNNALIDALQDRLPRTSALQRAGETTPGRG